MARNAAPAILEGRSDERRAEPDGAPARLFGRVSSGKGIKCKNTQVGLQRLQRFCTTKETISKTEDIRSRHI